jgi:hypothetical protein
MEPGIQPVHVLVWIKLELVPKLRPNSSDLVFPTQIPQFEPSKLGNCPTLISTLQQNCFHFEKVNTKLAHSASNKLPKKHTPNYHHQCMGQAIRPIFVKLSWRERVPRPWLLPKTVRVGNKAAFRSPDKECSTINLYVLLDCMK